MRQRLRKKSFVEMTLSFPARGNGSTSGTGCDDNLVPRAHVAFGQYQDTELWNNQFPETKILGLPASQRMRGLVHSIRTGKARKVEIWL